MELKARRFARALERDGVEAEANTMSRPNSDKVFTGLVPKLHQTYLVPLVFEPYAAAWRFHMRDFH